MKKKIILILTIFSLLFVSSLEAEAKRRVVRKKKQVIDFTAITIDGKLKRPLGAFILESKDKTFNKLLDINESFLEQIVKAADEF